MSFKKLYFKTRGKREPSEYAFKEINKKLKKYSSDPEISYTIPREEEFVRILNFFILMFFMLMLKFMIMLINLSLFIYQVFTIYK